MKKLLSIFIACIISVFAFGCSADGSGQSYSDEEFLKSLAAGLNAKWEIQSGLYAEGNFERTSKEYTEFANAELAQVSKYEKAKLGNAELTELANSYVAGLKQEKSAAEAYNFDDPTTIDNWNTANQNCIRILSQILKKFNVPYDEKYDVEASNVLAEGSELQTQLDAKNALADYASKMGVDFQETETGLIGKASLTNTTGFNFDTVTFDVRLKDGSGEDAGSYSCILENWKKDETRTVDMEFGVDNMPAKIEVICDSFLLAIDEVMPLEGDVPQDAAEEEGYKSGYVNSQGIVDPSTGKPPTS